MRRLTRIRTGPALSLVLAVAVCLVASGRARGQAPSGKPAVSGRAGDEAAIRAATSRYLAAIGRGDGAALAEMWTPDGDIVDDEGRVTNGREAVAAIAPAADAPRRAPTIRETRLRFLTADVAIEDGVVTVAPPEGGEPHEGWFSATWVRHEGGWRIAGLRESRISSAHDVPSLADLAWMVGDWTVAENSAAPTDDAGPRRNEPRIELSVRWNPTRTFLIRELSITPPADAADAGASPAAPTQITQRIGWDPLSRQIVSWVFGSDGSHGEATWSREDGTWIARTRSVLPDGTQTSALNIYAYDGAETCTWRSIPTHVGGEHAPHVSMTMVRKPPPTDRRKEDGR